MNHFRIRIVALVAGLVAAAPAVAWKPVLAGTPFTHERSGYTIQYPAGWRYIKMPLSDETLSTRDGPDLQAIYTDFRKHKKAFRALGQDSTPEMMPRELAEKIVAEATQARGLQNVQVLANEPTMLSGRPGFRLHFSYKTGVDVGSVRYEEFVVGANSPQGIFLVGYRAPVLHYFARDVLTFDTSLATFSIADKPK